MPLSNIWQMWHCEDDHTLHFALPLVDESVDMLGTSKARLGQALRTMAAVESRIHNVGGCFCGFLRAAAYGGGGRYISTWSPYCQHKGCSSASAWT